MTDVTAASPLSALAFVFGSIAAPVGDPDGDNVSLAEAKYCVLSSAGGDLCFSAARTNLNPQIDPNAKHTQIVQSHRGPGLSAFL